MEKKIVSRRNFLKLAGMAAGASVLAACAPQTVIVKETQIVEKQVAQTQIQTQIVKETSLVKETSIVKEVVTATPLPTTPPEPIVMDIWFNTDIPDITKEWKPVPENEEFVKQWYFGGLGRAIFVPWLEKHPGVSMNITTHSWDWDLRQNQLMGLAAGIIPDTTYGEAYVNEFVQLNVFSPLSALVASQFAPGTYKGAIGADGQIYGLAKSSGADVLFINLTTWEKAGLDRAKLPTTWEELVTACQTISKINKNEKYGNTCYYTYGPGGDSYGQAMRILHWFNQNGCPLGSDLGVPSANAPKAVETWQFHNDLMWSSTENLILQAESEAGSGQLFNDGVIAVKPGWNNDATSVGAGNIDGTAVQFPTPPGGSPATIVIGNDMHSALKGGKHPDLAIKLIEESLVNEEAQYFLCNNCGIWIPALKSLLEKADTFDKLEGYKTDTAKNIVRVTMKTLLTGNPGPVCGWPKNGSRIWAAWNDMYGRIWKGKMAAEDIQKELDTIQTTIEGLVKRSG